LGDEGLDGGLAVATEAKYGFLCRDGELTISLLRAPSEPDPQADRGHHCIRFALSRHQASTGQGRLSTAAAADALYAPVLLCRRQPPPPRFRLQSKGSLVPVWVLPSETETGTVIRLHETAGRRGSAAIERTRKELQVTRVNLLEEHISDLPQTGENRFRIDYEPYQVISLMLR
jgi:alpha-mannosidase